MVDIRNFGSGELYGLKVYDPSVRTGYKRVVASKYNDQLHGFEGRAISTEGVMRGYQALNFASEQEAMEWCHTELAQRLIGYDAEYFEIVKPRAGRFQRIPLAGVDFDGWVNPFKFDPISISERNMQHLIEVAPEYFDPDHEDAATEPTEEPQAPARRGFFI